MSTPSGEPPYPGSQPNQPGYDPNQGHPQGQQGYGAGQGHPNQQGRAEQGYPQEGHPQQGHPQEGYPQPGYGQPGYLQPDYAQPGYAQDPGVQPGPAGYGAGPLPPKNGLGIAALVLGILAILAAVTLIGAVVGIPLGLVALILGIVGVRRVGKGVATNKGVAIAGIVTGLLGLIASIAVAVALAAGATYFLNNGGGDLVQCIQDAGGDQARTLQCQQQYQQQVEDQLGGSGY